MKIAFIGCGAFGMALATHLSRKKAGYGISVWAHSPEEAERLQRERTLPKAFPGIVFPEDILCSNDAAAVTEGADLIVFALASPYTRSTAQRFADIIGSGRRIATVTKGIEEDTLMTQADIIASCLPGNEICALSGPTHAEEVVRALPTTIVAASRDRSTAEFVQDVFGSETLRVYTSPDVLGAELGGSLKNVIALAAGMLDGMGFGDNSKAALITRGIHEITNLALKMGALSETLRGLSGIGDLIVTCESKHSRNRMAGYLIGQGKRAEEAMKEVGQVVEGVYSAKAALALSARYETPLPICEEVNKILFNGKDPRDALRDLMNRDARMESNFREEDLPECWRTGNSR